LLTQIIQLLLQFYIFYIIVTVFSFYSKKGWGGGVLRLLFVLDREREYNNLIRQAANSRTWICCTSC